MTLVNEWESKKFIRIVLTTELAIIGLICITNMGFDIPIVRQFLGFIFLTFIPGLIILRILRLNKLEKVEFVLYSVGISISFIMALGFSINILYPIIGISNPISTFPLMSTLFIILLILCIIAYKREIHDKVTISRSYTFKLSEIFNPPILFLILLPLLSILGTYLVNFHDNNILLLILIPLIGLIPILIVFTNFIPSNVYPLAIISIAISLLWHWSLISIGLTGYDSHQEYYFQNLVLIHSIWNSSISSNVNSMLSITMLAPIYSLVLNMESIWIFKIVYPLFYSLVPLALFEIYRKQTSDKIAFMSSFFFMSLPLFFSEMTGLARQQIAELFLVLLVLVALNNKIVGYKRSMLSVVFGLSIIVSHYGLSYIYMIFLLLVVLFLLTSRSTTKSRYLIQYISSHKLNFKHIENSRKMLINNVPIKNKPSFNFILLFIVFCMSWYIYTGHGSPFDSAAGIFKHISESLYADFFNPEARDPMIIQAMGLSPMRGPEIEWEIARIFQQITQICILFGIAGLIFFDFKTKFYTDFIMLSVASLILIFISIVVPFFSSSLNMGRIYHITLLFLAPFCILGGKVLFQLLLKATHKLRQFRYPNTDTTKLVVILILVPYFMFSTGYVFYTTNSTETSMPLTLYQNDWLYPTYSEASTSKWLENNFIHSSKIYVDEYGAMLLYYQGMIEGSMVSSLLLPKLNANPENNNNISYIFLRRWNVLHHELRLVKVYYATPITTYISTENSNYSTSLSKRSKVYENGDTQILGAVI